MDDECRSMGLLFQTTAAEHSDRLAVIFEGQELNWGQLNKLVNQFSQLSP
jgi:non-ribosomal peptide synthetase component F